MQIKLTICTACHEVNRSSFFMKNCSSINEPGPPKFSNPMDEDVKRILIFRNETNLNLSPLKRYPCIHLYYFCCHFQTPSSDDVCIPTHTNERIDTKLLTDGVTGEYQRMAIWKKKNNFIFSYINVAILKNITQRNCLCGL